MCRCLSPFLSPDLTVFSSIFKWVKHVRILSASIIVMLILGYSSAVFPDTHMGDKPACSEVSGSAMDLSLCGSIKAVYAPTYSSSLSLFLSLSLFSRSLFSLIAAIVVSVV